MNRLRVPIADASNFLERDPLFKKVCLTLLLFCLAIDCAFGQKTGSAIETGRPLAPESETSSTERQLPPLQSPKQPVNCEIAGRYIDNAIARAVRIVTP
jgi:hypothetical protein